MYGTECCGSYNTECYKENKEMWRAKMRIVDSARVR